MWDLLETKRFNKLKESAVNLQGDMIFNQRCPLCTLHPPCKHYESAEHIVSDAQKLLQTKQFKQYMSPKKIRGLMNAIQPHTTQYDFNSKISPNFNSHAPLFNDSSIVRLDATFNHRGSIEQ